MGSQPALSADAFAPSVAVCQAIAQRYSECGGEHYGISSDYFNRIVRAVVARYGRQASEAEQLEIVGSLRVEELVLARACSAGNDAAWEHFLTRYRASMYDAARRIVADEPTARELADGLYGDLYGISGESGQRRSKLDYYMGRGSLEGWLRTVLAQQYVDRYRARRRDVSMEEQIESGRSFAAPPQSAEPHADESLSRAIAETLAELCAEERFLLATYYLDQQTLAEIGRQLRVHESTISRKLERLTRDLRKRVRQRLLSLGIHARRCEELMDELDVRDVNIDVAEKLRQEMPSVTFYRNDGSVT